MNDILFINGSPHTDGHTAQLAKALLQGKTYDTLQLTDLKIYAYGQQFTDDQYEEVMQAMNSHRIIVIGSPLYWHSMSGAYELCWIGHMASLKMVSLSGKNCFSCFKALRRRRNNWQQARIR